MEISRAVFIFERWKIDLNSTSFVPSFRVNILYRLFKNCLESRLIFSHGMETIIEQYSFFERWKIYLLLKIFIHEIQ